MGVSGVGQVGSGHGRAWRLRLHNVIHFVFASHSVRREQLEETARAAHGAYMAAALARGETPDTNPSMVPWDDLDDDLRRANLAQAADIERKLAAIDCVVMPERPPQPFEFTDEEIEILAQLEHERWMYERRGQGWTLGRRRDDAAKIHPDLVVWNELAAVSQDKDRDVIREIPAHLRNAGLGIVRRAPRG